MTNFLAVRPNIRFGTISTLLRVYLVATVLTLVFLFWKRDDGDLATTDAWVHAVIVFGFAVLLLRVCARAEAGAGRALLRLRVISVVLPVVSLVLVCLPGLFPIWMRVEQAAYGVLLLVVAALALRRPATMAP